LRQVRTPLAAGLLLLSALSVRGPKGIIVELSEQIA
jgi:hypothetical protein